MSLLSLETYTTTQPMAGGYFSAALSNQQLANTFVLVGGNTFEKMSFVLTLAQIINCKQPPSATQACGDCQPCRWIKTNSHPGIMTLANIALDDLKLKQNIQVEQFEELLSELSRHSQGFKRVVVLTGLQESTEEPTTEEASIWPALYKPLAEKGGFSFCSLNRKIFSDTVANKVLKTLEEPPLDTLFFLLVDAEHLLLETILSRAQVLRFRQSKTKAVSTPIWLPTLQQELNRKPDPLAFAQWLKQQADDAGLSTQVMLNTMLLEAPVLLEQWSQHSEYRQELSRLPQQLELINTAFRQLRDHVKEDAVLDELSVGLKKVSA